MEEKKAYFNGGSESLKKDKMDISELQSAVNEIENPLDGFIRR